MLSRSSEVTYTCPFLLANHEIFGKNDKLIIYTDQADATGMVAANSRGAAAESLFCLVCVCVCVCVECDLLNVFF